MLLAQGALQSSDFMQFQDFYFLCRYQNTPYKELSVAAIEQMKITEIRLRQVVNQPAASPELEKAERRTGQTRAHLGENFV